MASGLFDVEVHRRRGFHVGNCGACGADSTRRPNRQNLRTSLTCVFLGHPDYRTTGLQGTSSQYPFDGPPGVHLSSCGRSQCQSHLLTSSSAATA
ncbi:unnamed protein product [Protopolystoma xenopodis]|uniref:Uncharacterized protein n=1 Tax=Protopolystoma xenopodis TaxID=117903 RepID=A0A3S5BTY8_9PLAT|nr:unnamed protein product [Protopolystoma xenopodis]